MSGERRRTGTTNTTISVSGRLADELYSRKRRGESYEDVIWRLIENEGTSEAVRPRERTEDVERVPELEPEPVTEEIEQDLDAHIDDVVDDVIPGSGEKLQQRHEALHAVVDYLREHGTATPSELQRDVYPEHRAGYTDGADPARSWWKNCIYKALAALAERSNEIGRADQSGEWSYTGGGR